MKPASGASESSETACSSSAAEATSAAIGSLDAAAFANELQETIVKPLLDAREILSSQPYLTRLFTTMSAEEMTVDPEFDFNADAPAVPNQHTARGKMNCGLDGNPTSVEITLQDGRRYTIDYPSSSGIPDGPYAERVEQYTESGAPAVIADNTHAIDNVVVKFGGVAGGMGGGCGGCDAAWPDQEMAEKQNRLAACQLTPYRPQKVRYAHDTR